MMFYTTVCGWMLSYVPKMASGMFNGADARVRSGAAFNGMLADPVGLIGVDGRGRGDRAFWCAAWACRRASSASRR